MRKIGYDLPESVLTPVEEYFSAKAGKYHKKSSRGFWSRWRQRELLAIRKLLKPRRGEVMLDAGCGAGFYSKWLKKRGVEVTGCDFSHSMCEAYIQQLKRPVFRANLEAVALNPQFDGILSSGALEFCDCPERAIRHLADGLKPGKSSRLVIMVPTDGIGGWVYRKWHQRHGFSVHRFSRERLERMGRLSGLWLIRVCHVGFNIVAEYRHPN